MQFFDAVKIVFKKYADFRGTATRPEYWWFKLFVVLVGLMAGAIDIALRQGDTGPVQGILSVALFLPQLTVMVRRNRDAGFSAWWLMLWTLPFVVLIVTVNMNIDAMRVWFSQFADPNFSLSTDAQLAENLAQALVFLLPTILSFLAVGVFFFVVSLLPSKKKQQPVVATIDY